MAEYQTHAALVATLETEIVRLRAVNAELRSSIQAPIQPDTKLEQAARQALEALEAIMYRIERDLEHGHEWAVVGRELANEAITALREALEAQEPWTPDDMAYRPGGLSQHAAVEQERDVMLEALQGIAAGNTDPDVMVDIARAAIAKVEVGGLT